MELRFTIANIAVDTMPTFGNPADMINLAVFHPSVNASYERDQRMNERAL